jgi:hypothetical protein
MFSIHPERKQFFIFKRFVDPESKVIKVTKKKQGIYLFCVILIGTDHYMVCCLFFLNTSKLQVVKWNCIIQTLKRYGKKNILLLSGWIQGNDCRQKALDNYYNQAIYFVCSSKNFFLSRFSKCQI